MIRFILLATASVVMVCSPSANSHAQPSASVAAQATDVTAAAAETQTTTDDFGWQ